ncbi:hypothetical protein IAT38_002391 [Cryptococcus sp. DSM 104549]
MGKASTLSALTLRTAALYTKTTTHKNKTDHSGRARAHLEPACTRSYPRAGPHQLPEPTPPSPPRAHQTEQAAADAAPFIQKSIHLRHCLSPPSPRAPLSSLPSTTSPPPPAPLSSLPSSALHTPSSALARAEDPRATTGDPRTLTGDRLLRLSALILRRSAPTPGGECRGSRAVRYPTQRGRAGTPCHPHHLLLLADKHPYDAAVRWDIATEYVPLPIHLPVMPPCPPSAITHVASFASTTRDILARPRSPRTPVRDSLASGQSPVQRALSSNGRSGERSSGATQRRAWEDPGVATIICRVLRPKLLTLYPRPSVFLSQPVAVDAIVFSVRDHGRHITYLDRPGTPLTPHAGHQYPEIQTALRPNRRAPKPTHADGADATADELRRVLSTK